MPVRKSQPAFDTLWMCHIQDAKRSIVPQTTSLEPISRDHVHIFTFFCPYFVNSKTCWWIRFLRHIFLERILQGWVLDKPKAKPIISPVVTQPRFTILQAFGLLFLFQNIQHFMSALLQPRMWGANSCLLGLKLYNMTFGSNDRWADIGSNLCLAFTSFLLTIW